MDGVGDSCQRGGDEAQGCERFAGPGAVDEEGDGWDGEDGFHVVFLVLYWRDVQGAPGQRAVGGRLRKGGEMRSDEIRLSYLGSIHVVQHIHSSTAHLGISMFVFIYS